MIVKSRIETRGPKDDKYRLVYDLYDNHNTCLRQGVFIWDCRWLTTALLLERAIEKHGFEVVERHWLNADDPHTRQQEQNKRFPKCRERLFEESLQRLLVGEVFCDKKNGRDRQTQSF